MIDERQKPTTQAYRDNYDRIFRNPKSKSQAKRLLIQSGEIDPVICPQCMMWDGLHKMDCTWKSRRKEQENAKA